MQNTREFFDLKHLTMKILVKLGYSLPDPELIDEIEKGLNSINVRLFLY